MDDLICSNTYSITDSLSIDSIVVRTRLGAPLSSPIAVNDTHIIPDPDSYVQEVKREYMKNAPMLVCA